LDQIPFTEQVKKDLQTSDEGIQKIQEKLVKKKEPKEEKFSFQKFKDPFYSEEEDNRKSSKNFDDVKNFKQLVEEDINSEFKQMKKKVDMDEEKRKIAKMTNKPIYDSKGKDQDEKLRKTATLLGKLWQLAPFQKRHWYRQLKREEKEVAKKMIKL
jgi:hypothetical protein